MSSSRVSVGCSLLLPDEYGSAFFHEGARGLPVIFGPPGLDLMPAKLAELLVLVGLAVAITWATDRRRGVRQLFAGLLRWRLGWRYLLLVGAMPLLTAGVGAATGSLSGPGAGWVSVAVTYLIFLAAGAVTANLWEETVWGGFVQGRLMARHGLLRGSLLTAVPFFLNQPSPPARRPSRAPGRPPLPWRRRRPGGPP